MRVYPEQIEKYMRCQNPRWVQPANVYMQVPCGKCLACLTNKRNDWAFRLEQEYKRSKGAAFITLTYHPKFVPDSGVSKRHFQLFMKRLRKKSGDRLRYFAVGEYGTKTQRPHYHAIIFNYVGNESFLSSIWSTRKGESFGIVHIGKVNQATIMYCTKYVIQRGNAVDQSRAKPFMLCSRAYGLGLGYLTDEMAKWHRIGERNYTLVFGEKRRLSRYYKDKLWPRSEWSDWLHRREKIANAAKVAGEAAELENRRQLIEMGYKNPDGIIAEMRNAMLSRIKEKTAYTQSI